MKCILINLGVLDVSIADVSILLEHGLERLVGKRGRGK